MAIESTLCLPAGRFELLEPERAEAELARCLAELQRQRVEGSTKPPPRVRLAALVDGVELVCEVVYFATRAGARVHYECGVRLLAAGDERDADGDIVCHAMGLKPVASVEDFLRQPDDAGRAFQWLGMALAGAVEWLANDGAFQAKRRAAAELRELAGAVPAPPAPGPSPRRI